MQNPSFYSVIIGTELLNGRRDDSHFLFLNRELLKRGWNHKANFIIKDDKSLLESIFNLIKKDEESVMFSFGGIGSTPDDFTREIASFAFTSVYPQRHPEAEKIILENLGERAYPHPIKMADIPKGSKLVTNPVNNMPGFQLYDRFFFLPGFPQMAHKMVINILDKYYPKGEKKYSCSFLVHSSEALLIDILEEMPDELELSCLPAFDGDKRVAEIYLANQNIEFLKYYCNLFKDRIREKNIDFMQLSDIM